MTMTIQKEQISLFLCFASDRRLNSFIWQTIFITISISPTSLRIFYLCGSGFCVIKPSNLIICRRLQSQWHILTRFEKAFSTQINSSFSLRISGQAQSTIIGQILLWTDCTLLISLVSTNSKKKKLKFSLDSIQ